MQEAPQGATFVWCTDDTAYPKRLARAIKREDLQIVGVSWAREERWRGSRFSAAMVLDHAARFTEREMDLLRVLRGIARAESQ